MKYSVYCALIGMASAISIHDEPDVYGKNGENYKNVDPSQAMAKIGIDIKTQGTGDKCKVTDWATINWKGTLTNGEVVTDSLSENGPKTFTVGRDEVFKCWDLALQELQTGSKAVVSCPSELVWGGIEVQAPLGGDPVPKNSDVTFELEVLHCNDIPYVAPVIQQPHTTTMQPNKCFYFHSDKSSGSEIDLVLSTEPYSGSSWRNVIVEQFVRDDPEQQWFYDAEKNSVHNAAHPDLYLENWYGFLGTYSWYDGSDHQVWDYDGAKAEFFNGNEHIMAMEVENSNNVKTAPADDNSKNQKWHVEYCWKNW